MKTLSHLDLQMEVILHCYTMYVEHRTLCKTKVILLHILKNTFEGAGWQSDQFEHKKLFIPWCQGYLNTVWQNLLLPKIN